MDLSHRSRFFRSTVLATGLALSFSTVAAPLSAAWAQSAATQQGPESVADLAEGLLDAVVNISTSQNVKNDDQALMPQVPEGSPFQDFFDEFFKGGKGGEGAERQRKVEFARFGFRHRSHRLHRHQQPRDRGCRRYRGQFCQWLEAQSQADRHRHQDRPCRAEGGTEKAADGRASSAIRARCASATGSWRSATRSDWAER